MATKMQVPPADIQQIIEAAASGIELHGRVYVGDIRSTDRSQVRTVSLTVDIWPEGYQAELRGRIEWSLWGDQCETKGDEIKELYHGHAGLVIVRGIHMGKPYQKDGLMVDKIEATGLDFSKFGEGLTPPDYAILREQVTKLQEKVNYQQTWIDWLIQYSGVIASLSEPAPTEAI